jgi:hypothetical protein
MKNDIIYILSYLNLSYYVDDNRLGKIAIKVARKPRHRIIWYSDRHFWNYIDLLRLIETAYG